MKGFSLPLKKKPEICLSNVRISEFVSFFMLVFNQSTCRKQLFFTINKNTFKVFSFLHWANDTKEFNFKVISIFR